MEISVIVTVHNAEKFLKECLNSVITQTFSNIEILCMDGGSTDSSPQILKEYAAKDARLRIINDPDISYGHKINEGIRLAEGKYISVLESDDMYQPDMLEKLYTIAERHQPDFVNADYLEFFDAAGERYYSLVRMYKEEDYGYLQESGKHPECMRQITRYWTGLFKKEFLIKERIRMNESPGASFQDLSFRFLTSVLAETSYHVKEALYLYRSDNPGSSVYDPKKVVATADEFAFLKRELKKRNINNPYIWQHFYTWKYHDLYANMARFQNEAREALFSRSYQELEIDREILEKNNYWKYSDEITDLLNKSRQEIADDIDGRYQSMQRNNMRRNAFYAKIADRRLVIFGCGAWGKSLLKLLFNKEDKILCCTDNNDSLWGMEVEGCKVAAPGIAVDMYPEALFVIANKRHGDEIAIQLKEMGIQEANIYKY
jgi:glycosyltransferase involved in cell wall biosynthesis